MMAEPNISIAGDIEVRYRPSSGGPDLVMLHGIGSNLTSFDRLSRLLPDNWGLLAWNAPGYGASVPLSDAAPLAADYASRLLVLLSSLNLGAVVLVGHSLGTLIAAEFAGAFPERVTGLVLLASAQGYGSPKGQLGEKARARLDDLARLGAKEFSKARAPNLLHEPESRPDLEAETFRAMAAINLDGYTQAVHMLASGDLTSAAAKVLCPSVVLVGAHDKVTPPAQSQAVQAALVSATPTLVHDYSEVPGCGHLVHQENPKIVAQRLIGVAQVLGAEQGNAA